MRIVDATAPFACLFKPQHAHWEAIPGGSEALKTLVAYIHFNHPTIPVFIDCKRGDIEDTQVQYGIAHFEAERFDGMNFNGYMGFATVEPLARRHPGRAIVGLGRTSNPSAWEIQDALMADGRPLWEFMVEKQLQWFRRLGITADAGIVMGAAYLDPQDPNRGHDDHLHRVRQLIGDELWLLIPGVGKQGGLARATVEASFQGFGSIAVNSSSAIDFASKNADFAEAAAKVAYATNEGLMAV
jgi:orotidine-5'-phosphate decarboxylase